MITVPAVTPVPLIVFPTYRVPEPTTVTFITLPVIEAVTLAIAGVNRPVILKKFPTNWTFWKLTLFPVILIVEPTTVSSVKEGRLVPPPIPMTATSL